MWNRSNYLHAFIINFVFRLDTQVHSPSIVVCVSCHNFVLFISSFYIQWSISRFLIQGGVWLTWFSFGRNSSKDSCHCCRLLRYWALRSLMLINKVAFFGREVRRRLLKATGGDSSTRRFLTTRLANAADETGIEEKNIQKKKAEKPVKMCFS